VAPYESHRARLLSVPAFPVLRLAALVALAAASGEARAPRPQSGDTDRNFPRVIAPLYTFGHPGSDRGLLKAPAGLAVGKDDLLYVADTGNHRVQVFAVNGLLRGSFGSFGFGPGEFSFPTALAAAPEGEVYVADAAGRMQAFTPEGRFLKAWDGLRGPRGVAVTADRIYVTEGDLHRIRVYSRKDGADTAWGGLGSQPGRFLSPSGIAVDEDGAVYVADTGNHRIQKLGADGAPLAQWGTWGGQAGLLSYPTGLGTAAGRVTVADTGNHRIQVFDRAGTLIRQWGAPPAVAGEGDGRLHYPEGLAVSASGGLTVVAEAVDARIQVFSNRDVVPGRRVNDLPWWDSLHARVHAVRLAPPPPGSPPQKLGVLAAPDVHAVFFFDVATNALGSIVTAGGFGPKLGELNGAAGVAVDPDRGRAWVGDPGNRRVVVFEVPRSLERRELFGNSIRVVSAHAFDRIVPTPQPGYSSEASVPGPMTRSRDGAVFILDRANAAVLVFGPDLAFRRLIPVPATAREIAVASDGTLFVTDPVHLRLLAFDAGGKETARRDLSTGPGTVRMPWGVAADDRGFVYVADSLEDAVVKFDREGRFVKRWGTPGRQADRLSGPRAVAFYAPDRLIVEDYGNHRAQLCSTEGEWLGNYVAGGLATPIAIR
jgi:DNA-binding beta-propeller fold protein YncE